jgi:RNA polymerase sigma-70 factor (ECF subfamily)
MHIAVNLVSGDVSRSRRFRFRKRAQACSREFDAARAWIRDRGASPEEQAAARQSIETVWSVVSELSERHLTVFLLHFMEGTSPAEIETATGIPRAAIKVHLFRAVHAVRQRLGNTL